MPAIKPVQQGPHSLKVEWERENPHTDLPPAKYVVEGKEKNSGRWSEIGRTDDASETEFPCAITCDQQYTSVRVGSEYTDRETTFSSSYPLRVFETESEGKCTHVHVHIACPIPSEHLKLKVKVQYMYSLHNKSSCVKDNVYLRKQGNIFKPIQLILHLTVLIIIIIIIIIIMIIIFSL